MEEDMQEFHWTDEMIEGLVEDEMSLDKAGQITDFEYEGLAYTLPDGYIFKDENGNVINATKIVLEKKKTEYPKTYEECENILGLEDSIIEGCLGYEYKLLNAFQKLLMCRDAYWTLYGEEMGLEKPWEPDWLDDDVIKYIISHDGKRFGTRGGLNYINYILAFPTEEMRDYFYENFKELIEICKELL